MIVRGESTIINYNAPFDQGFTHPLSTRSTNMARKAPCLFLKRLLAVCVISEPVTGAMAAERSVHSAGIAEVHRVPINVINRPIPPVLEEEKVKSLMKTIEVRTTLYNVEANFTCNL